MSDWPASAAAVRAAHDDPRWHTSGAGPFVLMTRSYIIRDGAVEEFRCVHRFESPSARESYRKVAVMSGLQIVEGGQ